MKYLQCLFGILLMSVYPCLGQIKSSDEMMNFKQVWFIDNREASFKLTDDNKVLLFQALFNKDSVLSFSIDFNYSCSCIPTLDKKYVVKRITSHYLYYQAEYVYSEFNIDLPKKKLVSKKIPVQVWFNRMTHHVTLKINNKIVTKQQAYFASSYSLNSRIVKYGTLMASSTSIQ